MRPILNRFKLDQVDYFNALVADFNNRCGHFSYQKGALEVLSKWSRKPPSDRARRASLSSALRQGEKAPSRAASGHHLDTAGKTSTPANLVRMPLRKRVRRRPHRRTRTPAATVTQSETQTEFRYVRKPDSHEGHRVNRHQSRASRDCSERARAAGKAIDPRPPKIRLR